MQAMLTILSNIYILYIDPGTGSMLFAVLLALLSTLAFFFRSIVAKLQFIFTGGRSEEKKNADKLSLVIFADDKRYWNVFKPICAELDRRGINFTYMTASPDDPALQEIKTEFASGAAEFIGSGNKAFARLNYLNAKILLATTPGLDVYQWKRSPDVDYYVHIPHAASDLTVYRMFGLDYYDAVLVSGDYQIRQVRALERRRNLPPKDVVKVGIPYMDAMAQRLAADQLSASQTLDKNQQLAKQLATREYRDNGNEVTQDVEAHQTIYSDQGQSAVKKSEQTIHSVHLNSAYEIRQENEIRREIEQENTYTVLLAPSWGESAILQKYGGSIIAELLATGYHIIIRPHPQSFKQEKDMLRKLEATYPASAQLEWNRDNDNYEVLKRSDILISDFSGVIFDFALVYDKPVIYTDTEFDDSPYDAWWLGEELWTFTALPKLGIKLAANNINSLKEVIDTCLTDPQYKAGREKLRSETWAFPGEGSRRTVDFLVRKLASLENSAASEAEIPKQSKKKLS